ncbi:predicted protein [Histoplasma capsulatum var. duboisii H88]|uniref:Predicted protein n=2 Tax=Ajellomyces capsulatus TaxID=5037 RepID=F0UD94_AJEC8|nr:predicted protein [Histoplasma capsulatum H143]EGC43478.1 predicted protein [Histoplasma capsulatum var. duboisii H88]
MAGYSHRNGREGDINPINAYIFNKWGRWPSQVKPDPSLGARKPPPPLPTTRLGAVRPNQIRLEGAAATRRIRPTERLLKEQIVAILEELKPHQLKVVLEMGR